MSTYVTTGIHIRTTPQGTKVWKPGEKINPTKFELASFPDKFKAVGTSAVVAEPENTDGVTDYFALLAEAQSKLDEVIVSEEWEDEVIEEAKRLRAKNPEKEHTIASHIEKIDEFLTTLNEVEGEE